MMGTAYFTAVILLIMISSIITPVVLKFLYDVFPKTGNTHQLVDIKSRLKSTRKILMKEI